MRFLWPLVAPMLASCGLSVAGTAPLDGGSPDGASDFDGSAPPAQPGDGSSSAGDSGCDPSACPGVRCKNGACATFADCRDLRDNAGNVKSRSATYLFGRADGGAFSAYCEMTLAGGGWTLIAQSGVGATTSFGWRAATGSVANTSAPYSLDALGHGLSVTELLLATGTRASIAIAYVVGVPAGFPAGYDDAAGPTTLTKIQNPNCHASGATPIMLKNLGRTALTDRFFFRDFPEIFSSGLYPAGWRLLYPTCDEAGTLTGSPGMLFVR